MSSIVPSLTVSSSIEDRYGTVLAVVTPLNARDKGPVVKIIDVPVCADADGIGLGSNTGVADVDIRVTRSEGETGCIAHRDITTAGGVLERCRTNGRVEVHFLVAGLALERQRANGRVVCAGGGVLSAPGQLPYLGCHPRRSSFGAPAPQRPCCRRQLCRRPSLERQRANGRVAVGHVVLKERPSAKGRCCCLRC